MHYSLYIPTKNDHIPCILVPPKVRTRLDTHLSPKTTQTNLFFKLANKNRSANTTPSITASMSTYKDIGSPHCLGRSIRPLRLFHKHLFHKVNDAQNRHPPITLGNKLNLIDNCRNSILLWIVYLTCIWSYLGKSVHLHYHLPHRLSTSSVHVNKAQILAFLGLQHIIRYHPKL